MLIHVYTEENRFDYVKSDMLDDLIESRGIAGFKRTSGWVTVGFGPMRQAKRGTSAKTAIEAKGLIQVEYTDRRYDYVSDTMLDMLLESNKVVKFKRSSGWATVGVDSIRMSKR
jgi:hypothetical protein